MELNKVCYNEAFDATSGLIINLPINIPPMTTVLGYVIDGVVEYRSKRGPIRILAGNYFSINHKFLADERVRVFGKSVLSILPGTVGHNVSGLMDVDGPGHVKYIDGCTDSLLVAPTKLGAPCLNALYFPPNTVQSFHTHSSFRVGVVVSGNGLASLNDSDFLLTTGDCFYIYENEVHRFKTVDSPMSIIAIHPDSDWGPTDECHPMINKTDLNCHKKLF